MRIPIPDDWDGESWRCLQLQWPNSVKWLGVLNGLLTLATRGRLWDEETGTVTDAQVVGRAIFERNFPYVDCGGDPLPPEIIEIIRHVGCGDDESEDEDMGCNGPIPFKEEEGILYYYYCCEWVPIFARNGESSTVVEDPYADNDPAPVYSACSKAKAIVDTIYLVMDTVWENQTAAPWQYVGLVEDAVKGHNDLDDNQIISAFLTALAINSVYDYSDVFDPIDRQQLLCGVASLLADDAAGITRDQWNEMIGIIKTNYGAGLSTFVRACAEAIGPSDMREITALMSLDQSYDCGCPDPLDSDPTVDWTGMDWVHYWNFKLDDYEWIASNVLTEYVAGQGWVDWADEGTAYAKTAIEIPLLHETGSLARVWIKFHVGTNFNYSGDLWKIQTDTGNIDQAVPGGDPVSVGGDIVFDKLEPRAFVGTDNRFALIIEGHVDGVSGATDPDSPRVIGIALAGTGTDPFVA